MISFLVLTLNEEVNLPRCLDSIAWSDDILVLDSFSTDRTLEIARSRGARVMQNRFINFAEQRNFGLKNGGFKYDWVFHLDADEEITPELKDEILSVVQIHNMDAYRVASKVIFMGRWLKHAGLYPWYQVRLGKRKELTFVQAGHGQRENLDSKRIGTLKNPMLHHSFAKGFEDWLEKHNRYSTAEAQHYIDIMGHQSIDWFALFSANQDLRRRALKSLFSHMPCRPLLRFLYMYFIRLGFLDGMAGFYFCRLLAMYESMIVLKTKELRWRRQSG